MAFHWDASQLSSLETILRLHGLFRHRLQALRISPIQAGMLLYLHRHPHCRLNEIASALCLQNHSTVETARFLKKKGLLQKTQTHENQRIGQLRLTVKGRALAQKIRENIEVTDKLFSLASGRKAA